MSLLGLQWILLTHAPVFQLLLSFSMPWLFICPLCRSVKGAVIARKWDIFFRLTVCAKS